MPRNLAQFFRPQENSGARGVSARLPILRATAGVPSARNLFCQRCAEMVDSALRADGSFPRAFTLDRLGGAYRRANWLVTAHHFAPLGVLPLSTVARPFRDVERGKS